MHPNAVRSCQSLRACAGRVSSDAYWQVHDMLYVNQRQWAAVGKGSVNAQFVTYAAQLGIDTTAFTGCLSGKYRN
jgi:protein-disulfide isomerase